MDSSKLQTMPRVVIGKQQATLFDECKAVLSRLGLYRHIAADDQHTDQFKAPGGGTQRKPDDAQAKGALCPASPPSPNAAAHTPTDEHHNEVQHSSLALDNHTTRDQLPQAHTPHPAAPTPTSVAHPTPHTHHHQGTPRRFSIGGDSMASCVSMGSWDARVHARATRSPRASTASSQGHGTAVTRPPDHQLEPPHASIAKALTAEPMTLSNTPPAAPGVPTANRRPTRQVMMYVHAMGEPIDRYQLEQQAAAVMQVHPGALDNMGTGSSAAGPPPVSTPQPIGALPCMMSGMKRQHSQSTQCPADLEGPGAMPISPTEAMPSLGPAPWSLVSPNQHMGMRRSNRPASVPELNFSVLPHVDCDSPYGQNNKPNLPNLPESVCQCLDPEEEDRLELESWAAPARWLPASEGRHYVFKPVNSTEIKRHELLRSALPPPLAVEVDRLWNSLIEARYACELMSSRGVRVVKDVTREWSEMSSHLIQRIEAHESAAADMQAYCHQQNLLVQQLTYQLKLSQAAAAANMPNVGGDSGSVWGSQSGSGRGTANGHQKLRAGRKSMDMTQDVMASVEMAIAHAAHGAHMTRQPRRADRGGQVHAHLT